MIGGLLKVVVLCLMIVVPDFSAKRKVTSTLLPKDSTIPELTLENVYREMLFMDIKHPDIVLRQVIVETMWLKCDHCSLNFNNLFGFTTRKGYMKFKNWVDCLKFYKQWQEKLKVTGEENYYALLKRAKFAVFEEYNQRLRSVSIRHITEKFETPRAKLPNPVDLLVRVER